MSFKFDKSHFVFFYLQPIITGKCYYIKNYNIRNYKRKVILMTKTELIDVVAKETELTKKDTGKIINTTMETIMNYLGQEAKKPEEERDKVQIIGFGTFEARNRASKKGRNPQTGEEITIPERKVPFFKSGKTFKKALEK